MKLLDGCGSSPNRLWFEVKRCGCWLALFAVTITFVGNGQRAAIAAEVTSAEVENSIKRAKQFLVSKQSGDGSWSADFAAPRYYVVGVTSLATLALLNAGMSMEDEPIDKAVRYLRSIKEPDPDQVYEISLMIMALVAAKDGNRDIPRITQLAAKLEAAQFTAGNFNGGWGYDLKGTGGGDNSNSQFAVLGLREAAVAGVHVDKAVWERIRRHWLAAQSGDGGWNYHMADRRSNTGSMTVAGIATLSILETMLRDEKDLNPDGTPNCCGESKPNDALERGIGWMERNFSVGHNPGAHGTWLLYYLYGVERAGRLSGRRFFGAHDWYREGARFLIDRQSQRDGRWQEGRLGTSDAIVGTSFGLLFLSKGLAPVLINKLKYGDEAPVVRGRRRAADAAAAAGNSSAWNQHSNDIRNLTEHISTLDKWPKLLTWQQVEIRKVLAGGGVQDLLQAPILYISGTDNPAFSDEEIELIKNYTNQGGFIFAVNNCNGAGFDLGMREMVKRMYPEGEVELKLLPPDHPVYRAEYPLEGEGTELWGVDLGCRTVMVYSPDDHACLWDKISFFPTNDRPVEFTSRIIKSTKVGVNVVAYATGREPFDKLNRPEAQDVADAQDQIQRGFVQIAKLRHTGEWNAAPNALRNLLTALNEAAGMVASTKQRDLTAVDQNLFKYPVLYMHGRSNFTLMAQERAQIREYLNRGNVLFADACCGSPKFDAAFRTLITELYPDKKFERIPANHELFSTDIGFDIRKVKRRSPESGNANSALDANLYEGEPFLEAIEVDGRYSIIYSKYDISCALERQASVACAGYTHEDAVRIAVNIIRYAMLQNISYKSEVEPMK